MANNSNNQGRLLKCTYYVYDRETGTFVAPIARSFYSSSTNPRNLCDMAARIARQEQLKWDKMIIRRVAGETLAERTRMYYNVK